MVWAPAGDSGGIEDRPFYSVGACRCCSRADRGFTLGALAGKGKTVHHYRHAICWKSDDRRANWPTARAEDFSEVFGIAVRGRAGGRMQVDAVRGGDHTDGGFIRWSGRRGRKNIREDTRAPGPKWERGLGMPAVAASPQTPKGGEDLCGGRGQPGLRWAQNLRGIFGDPLCSTAEGRGFWR